MNDVVPTLYDILDITPPRVVNGIPQDPFDGVSFKSTFNDAKAKEVKKTQYFEIMGSRAIYHDGWMASAFGPRTPWIPGLPPGIREWTPDKDRWELYNLAEDWSQANDLAEKMPQKLADLKDLFLIEFTKNKGLPIGGGLYIAVLRPELRIAPPYKEWTFSGDITRMPEFNAPALGNKPNLVTVDAEIPANANGVLYALGAFSGGLSCYMKDGVLSYEYNLFEIMRTQIKSRDKIPTGKVKIEIETGYAVQRPAGPLKVVMKVNGKAVDTVTTVDGREVKEMGKVGPLEVGPGIVPISAPLGFTANDCLDIGTDLGSPVSLDYFDKAPFKFNGKIEKVNVKYMQ